MGFANVAIVAVAALGLLPSASAVNLRYGGADQVNASVHASDFSKGFVTAVDAAIFPRAKGGVFLSAKPVHSHVSSLMMLAAKGAQELDVAKALAAISPPDSVTKMLRHGYKVNAGANMWKAGVDKAIIEKAIVNLNGMVFQSQIRLDAKNDECEEFKAKYTETLDQINGDLARMGEELSNTARAILVHMGGIDANILNNQQTKEELQREFLAYSLVRNADLIVLQERQTNMAVSAFILVFSACPDAPSAASSASMIQGASFMNASVSERDTATYFKQCQNDTTGRTDITFHNPKLHDAAQRLSDEAQDVLLRFISKEMHTKGGKRIAVAAGKIEGEALAEMDDMTKDLDDGDDSSNDEESDDEDDHSDESQGSFIQNNKANRNPQLLSNITATPKAVAFKAVVASKANATSAQEPPNPSACGVVVERIAIDKDAPCNTIPASCCGCNRYWTTAQGNGNDEMGWCSFVPEERLCHSGLYLKKNPNAFAEKVCGAPEDDYYDEPAPEETKAASRCANAVFDCGVLHDMFAALWGETKDLVDELVWKMNKDTAAWEKVKGDINTLFQTQATQLSNLQSALAEASAAKAGQLDEQAAKQKEKTDVTDLFERTMKECQDVMKEILFMDICGVLAVRNNIIAKNLPGEPTPTDCAVGEWVAADCSVTCDDELAGGVHNLAREVMVVNTPRGVDCPALTTQRKCKQIPCPVECGLSHWSAWGKCSKECGGGIQSQTRSMEVKPKNGGKACDALTQSQPCNDGACDVDCVLGKFMEFKPCTKACNAGYEERRKRVLTETKGDGFCLPWNHEERLERKPCNTHACTGDEMCNSTLDLVLAIDSSGSITEAGFDILKEFAVKIVQRMMAPVQVGIVLFGNGKLDLETNIISDAKVVTDNLEGDMESVEGKIKDLIIHKGFTNMAQAFTKSKDVLTYARKGAATAVVIITDGRPSFKFQTGHAVTSLRKSARVLIIHVQANKKKEVAEMLKTWVSEPSSANYRYIAGKSKLAKAMDSYVTSEVADLCPKLISPSAITECTVTDGSGVSEAYPCECGASTPSMCKTGEVCFGDDQFCVDPELMFVQGKKISLAAYKKLQHQ